jgi:hypothetical protein
VSRGKENTIDNKEKEETIFENAYLRKRRTGKHSHDMNGHFGTKKPHI